MQHIITVIRLLFLGLFIFLLAKGKLMLWFALFAVSLVVALIFGRIYCGYVCPMNTLMIPTEWIAKKLKLQTNIAPKWLKDRNYTWVALASSVAIMIFSKRLLSINIPILPIWLIISILVTLRYKPAVFHNLICPFGALQRACGKFAGIVKKVDAGACIGCKLCEMACPAEAIAVGENKKAVIDSSLCHQCNTCEQACPQNTISYAKRI